MMIESSEARKIELKKSYHTTTEVRQLRTLGHLNRMSDIEQG